MGEPKQHSPSARGNSSLRSKNATPGQAAAVLGAGALIVAALAVPYTDIYRERRYRTMSLETLAREADAHPADGLFLYWQGHRLNEAGRYTEASKILEQTVNLDPDSARVRDAWAQSQLASGRASQAYSQLKQFAAAHPNDAQAHLLLGKLHLTLGADHQAVASLNEATRLDPQQAEAWSLLGDVYRRLMRDKEAGEALRRAVALEPDRAAAQASLGSLLSGRDPQAAGAALSRAVALEPQNASYRREWADFLYSTGDRTQAEAQAREAVRLAPRDARAHLILGRCLTERKEWADASRHLEDAARLAPFDSQAPQSLRRLYTQTGEAVKARQWERAYNERQAIAAYGLNLTNDLLKQPLDPSLNRKMARHQARLGNVEQCVRHAALAQSLPPDAPDVIAAAAADFRAVGREEAARALEKQMLPGGAVATP